MFEGVKAWGYWAAQKAITPVVGGVSAVDAAVMAVASALLYRYWGSELGAGLAEKFSINPPADQAFETAGGSFAVLIASLGLKTVKNLLLAIRDTVPGCPGTKSLSSFVGALAATGFTNIAALAAFPLIVTMLGQHYLQEDNDDQLAADIARLDRAAIAALAVYVAAAVYACDRASRGVARASHRSEQEEPLLVQHADLGRPKTIGQRAWGLFARAGDCVASCLSSRYSQVK